MTMDRVVAEKVMAQLKAMDVELGAISATIDAMSAGGEKRLLTEKLADILAAQNGMVRVVVRAHRDLDPDQ